MLMMELPPGRISGMKARQVMKTPLALTPITVVPVVIGAVGDSLFHLYAGVVDQNVEVDPDSLVTD